MNEQSVILVPVDFSPKSIIAFEQATHLAKLLKHDIMLLYVHEETGVFSKLFSDSEEDTKVMEKLQNKLNEISNHFGIICGVRIKTMLGKGRISTKIVEIAEMLNAHMIVMGTNSEEDHVTTIGANTHRVVRWAKCPVITINGLEHHSGCRSILLPLDISNETRQKVTRAIEMAKYFGSTIKVVSALSHKYNKAQIIKIKSQLNQVENFILERNIDCNTELIETTKDEKSVVPIILKYAEEQGDIDLIMIMTQQEVGWIEKFIDSEAQEMIRTAKIPVMSIAPKEIGIIESKGF